MSKVRIYYRVLTPSPLRIGIDSSAKERAAGAGGIKPAESSVSCLTRQRGVRTKRQARATAKVGPATPSYWLLEASAGPRTERRRGYQLPWAGGEGNAGRPGSNQGRPQSPRAIIENVWGRLSGGQGEVRRVRVAEGVGVERPVGEGSEASHHVVRGQADLAAQPGGYERRLEWAECV